MSRLDQYADWLINNQDKKGTPDFETVADAYRSLRAAPAPIAPAPSPQRTVGEAFTDVGAGLVSGLGGLLQVPGQLTKLVPGMFGVGEALEAPGEALSKLGESFKSEGLKVREAMRSKAISEAEKEGILSEFVTAIGQTIKDPALLSTFIAEQLPQLIGPAAAVKAAKIGMAGKTAAATAGLTGDAATEAAKEVAKQYGTRATRAAIGTGAVMQGADIASDTYDAALKAAKEQGLSDEEAQSKALNAARLAGLGAGAISVGTQFLPGAKAIERRMAGLPGEGRIRGALGEAVSEMAEEGGGAFAQNLAIQQLVNPAQSLTQGIGTAAGLGAIGGGLLGGVLSHAKPKPGETDRQMAERLVGEIDALQKQAAEQQKPLALEYGSSNPMTVFPDGSVGRAADVQNYINGLPENQQSAAMAKLLGMGEEKVKEEEKPIFGLPLSQDPLISFPDGSIGRKSEVEGYIASLPENQQTAARAKLMGMGEQEVKPEAQIPPPVLALGLSQDPLIVFPDGTVGRKSEVSDYLAKLPESEQVGVRARLLGLGDVVFPSLQYGVIGKEDLKNIGFPRGKIHDALLGMNVVSQADDIRKVLTKAQESAHPTTQLKISDFLVNLDAVQGFAEKASQGEVNVGEAVQPPSGEGAAVAVQPSPGAPAEGAGEAQPSGVVPAVPPAGAVVGGEGAAPAPVVPPVAPAAPPAPPVAEPPAAQVPAAPPVAPIPTPIVSPAQKTPTLIQQTEEFGKAIGAARPYRGSIQGRMNLPAQKAAEQGDFPGVVNALASSKNATVAEVAKRAKDLGTKIVIDDNAEETYAGKSPLMRQMSIDGAKMHLEALQKIRELAPKVDALPDGASLFDLGENRPSAQLIDAFDGGEQTGRVSLERLAESGHSMFSPLPTGPIKLRTKEDFKTFQKAFEDLTQEVGEDPLRLTSTGSANMQGIAGVYDAQSDTIRVPSYAAKRESVLAHEIVHAQTVKEIAKPSTKNRPVIKRLENLHQHVKAKLEEKAAGDKNFRMPYGIESLQEFVAEGMSNPRFQFELNQIEYKSRTAWDAFTQSIADLLGIKKNTAFTEILGIYGQLTALPQTTKTTAPPVAQVAAPPVEPPAAPPVAPPAEEEGPVITKNIRQAKPRKPPSTVMGSPLLALVNNLGGLSPSLLSEFSFKVLTNRKDRNGRRIAMWRSPPTPQGGLFRKGGREDYSEIAEMLEDYGYLEPGSVERDFKEAGERAKDLIKAALSREQVLTVEEQTAEEARMRDEFDKEEQARMDEAAEIQRQGQYPELDPLSASHAEEDRQALIKELGFDPNEIESLTDAELPFDLSETTDEADLASGMRERGFSEADIQEVIDGRKEEAVAAEAPEGKPKEAEKAAEPGEAAPRAVKEEPKASLKERQKVIEAAKEREAVAPAELSKEIEAKINELEKVLRRMLGKMGLENVALEIARDLRDSNGEYANQLIKLALNAQSPVRDLRHESIHAMKELGFFTDKQWATLEKMAKDKWIDQYLKSRTAVVDGKTMSRYDAYVERYGGNMDIVIEEAIADAFGDFDLKKPPPGFLRAMHERMKQFFRELGSAMGIAGLETAEDIFRKAEKGELKATKAAEAAAPKASLRAPEGGEFKQWFGKSKIINLDGSPRVMYHGTARDITTFKPKQAGAIFVTDRPSFAEGFADASADWLNRHAKDILTTEQFAQMQEKIDSIDDIDEKDQYRRGFVLAAVGSGPNLMPIYVKAENPFDFDNKEHIDKLKKYEQENRYTERSISYSIGAIESGSWEEIERKVIQNAIKSLGFDGFYVKEGGVKNLAVYSPDQIKSATGNIGAYGQRPITKEEAARFGMTAEEAKEAQKAGDIRFSLRSAQWSDERINRLLNQYSYTQNGREDATKAYAAFIRPEDFLNATTTKEYRAKLETEKTPLDVAKMAKEDQEIFLEIELTADDGVYQIVGHEGRHRMMAMRDAGVNAAPVTLVMRPYGAIENAQVVEEPYFKPQQFDDRKAARGFSAMEMIPISWNQRQNLKDTFGGEAPVKFSLREGPVVKQNIRDTTNPAAIIRMQQTTVPRKEEGFVKRMMDAIAPKSASHFRAAALNRYNYLAEADKKKIALMGGKRLFADASAEAAALNSDLAAGLAASAFGVHDRKGGVPVYVRHFAVEVNHQQVGPNYATKAQAEAAAAKNGGVVRERGHTIIHNDGGKLKGPLAIFAPLAKYGDPLIYQKYQFWAGVKRGSRFMEVTRPDGTVEVLEKNFEKSDIPLAEEILREHPEFETIQKEWVEYNNGLVKFLVDTGVISEAGAKEMTKHGDYMPFYRQLEEEEDAIGPKVFQSIGTVKAPKKIKHGEAAIGDFLENLVRNTQSSIHAGIKNIAARRAADVGMDVNMVEKAAPGTTLKFNQFTVMENGNPVAYETKDQLFTDAVKSLHLPDMPFIGLLSGPANLLRNLVTKDPAFMLANMMRDSMQAWTTSGLDMKPMVSTLGNFAQAIAGKSPVYEKLLNAGILGGHEYAEGVKAGAKKFGRQLRKTAGAETAAEKALKPATYVWEALEKGTTASDAATRMEIYKKTLEETGNEAEAIYRALEVMNFNRKGSSPVIRILTAAVPFLNARMQGLDVLYRAAIAPTVGKLRYGIEPSEYQKEIQKTFFVRGMTIAALSCMYWALTHDDDDYKKQEQETRDNYWLIPSVGIKIPIPFEVGVMFKVMPERIMAYAFGDDTGKDFIKSMGRNLWGTLGFNPIPQAALPIVETMTNYSFFTGRAIVGQGMDGVAPEFQVGPGTSKLAEGIGKGLGMSPMKVDALLKGYTGTMGTYMVDLMDAIFDLGSDSPKADKRFEQLPFFKRFAVDPQARGQVTAYYEMKDEIDQIVRTSNFLEKTMDYKNWGEYMQDNMKMLATKQYILDMEKTMKQFRDMRNMINISQMSGADKMESLRGITDAENQLTSNIQKLRKMMSE